MPQYKIQRQEIANQSTPPSESASEEDSDPEQAQKDKEMQKNLALIAKYFKKSANPSGTTSELPQTPEENKNVDTTPKVLTCKEFGHFAKEFRKPKTGLKTSTFTRKDACCVNKLRKGHGNEEIDETRVEDITVLEEILGREVLMQTQELILRPLETVDYDKLEHKLNEALRLIAQKEIDIKEGLKVKAYEISVVKEKHDEIVK
ncbi:hypothetical protein Tco_0617206 [Tanacetum coccineum]